MRRRLLHQVVASGLLLCVAMATPSQCPHSGGGALRYAWGDALQDANCLGPGGHKYPSQIIANIVRSYKGALRKGRAMEDPFRARERLLDAWRHSNEVGDWEPERTQRAAAKSNSSLKTCRSPTGRLCRTTYNTTAPLYGISLTSGQHVTIVQKFPDLLQQVIFETCASTECDILHGQCSQTYTPYLFLVVPLGPVTLTGQDYVMVESGCVCKTKPSQAA